MAFVSQADRGIERISKTVNCVGPGAYEVSSVCNNFQSYAPFFSTTQRQEMIMKQSRPGPCEYVSGNKLGQPSITTYSNNTSIIIKLNSMGTQPFLSKQKRFKDETNVSNLGPGQYISIASVQKKKQHRRRSKTNKLLNLEGRVPSIYSKTIYLNERRIKTQQSQNDQSIDHLDDKKGVLVSAWGKSKVKRFSDKCYTEIGPGKYESEPKQFKSPKKNRSSGFASNTVRTIFDTLVYNTTNQQTLQFRANSNYKPENPAPGSYDVTREGKKETENYKNNSFGSNLKRFAQIKPTDMPFYDVQKNLKPSSHHKKSIPFNSQASREVENRQSVNPGPSHYKNINPHQLKYVKNKAELQNFGSFVKRPYQQQQKPNKVGPGYYYLPQRWKSEQKTESFIFKSSIQRQYSIQHKSDNKFASYDVNQSDISRRISEIKIHRQNLEKIDCQVPPFNKKSPRFKHYESSEETVAPLTIKQRQAEILLRKEMERQRMIQQARNQLNEKKGFALNKGERFKEAIGGPGVGNYTIRSNWTKKSYNIKYNLYEK